MNKQFTVEYGPRANPARALVELNGVVPEEHLTPKLARRAARIACGHANGVTVWDSEYGHGYRLYSSSARKLHQD